MKHARWWGLAAGLLLGALDTGTAVAFGWTVQGPAGQDYTLLTGLYLAGSFGLLGYLVGLSLEARRAERAATGEAEARRLELAEARARLAEAERLASLGTLASAIAHEVRNPLAIVRSSVQNVSEGLEPAQADEREACSFVIEEVDRLSRVTRSLLDFARPVTPRREAVRVEALVARAGELARAALAERGRALEVAGSAGAAGATELQVDPDLVCQVVLTLVTNADQVSPAERPLTLRIDAGEQLELAVLDEGPGIPDELREKIFEPFFTTREGGHGLGLAVARQVATAHGGELAVENRPEGGARFALRLPLQEAA